VAESQLLETVRQGRRRYVLPPHHMRLPTFSSFVLKSLSVCLSCHISCALLILLATPDRSPNPNLGFWRILVVVLCMLSAVGLLGVAGWFKNLQSS
jgi:hypothetical protein